MVIFLNLGKPKIDGHFDDFGHVKIINKTPLGQTGCLGNPYFLLTGCLGIRFLDSPPFFSTQLVRLPLVTYLSLWSACVTYRTPCHSIGDQWLPTQSLPRVAKDLTRGGKHSKHVPPLSYLA